MRLSTKKRLLWTGLLAVFFLAHETLNRGMTARGLAIAVFVAVITFVLLTFAAIDPEDKPTRSPAE